MRAVGWAMLRVLLGGFWIAYSLYLVGVNTFGAACAYVQWAHHAPARPWQVFAAVVLAGSFYAINFFLTLYLLNASDICVTIYKELRSTWRLPGAGKSDAELTEWAKRWEFKRECFICGIVATILLIAFVVISLL